MAKTLQLVLFDMDDVLCRYTRAARVQHLAQVSGKSPAQVYSAIWESGLEGRADAGSISNAAYLNEISERLGYAVTLEDWLAARSAAMQADHAVLALAKAVAQRCRIAVLTNNCSLVGEHIVTLCPPIAEVFGEGVHCSASFGAAKPQAAVFARCLSLLGATAAQTLFIDDILDNAQGAAAAGLQAHHFRDAAMLRKVLVDYDLIRE